MGCASKNGHVTGHNPKDPWTNWIQAKREPKYVTSPTADQPETEAERAGGPNLCTPDPAHDDTQWVPGRKGHERTPAREQTRLSSPRDTNTAYP
jgi:hypothetical protein